MRQFDLTPLYRTTVGFDHLGSLLDTLGSLDNDAPSYPPPTISSLSARTRTASAWPSRASAPTT
jgi:molecular chaperone IbpA